MGAYGLEAESQRTTGYVVRLGTARKHPTKRAEFETAYQARAEAAAVNATAVVERRTPRGPFRVFGTDKPKGFVPTKPLKWTQTLKLTFESLHNHRTPGLQYATAVDDMHRTQDAAEKAKKIVALLERHFEFDPSELHVAQVGEMNPQKVTIETQATGFAGVARFVDTAGARVKMPTERGGSLPKAAFGVTHQAFDRRTRLFTWRVLVHEELHVRMRKQVLRLLEQWRNLTSTGTADDKFFLWLKRKHASGTIVAGMKITDELWIVAREQGDSSLYAVEGGGTLDTDFLSECLGSIAGFEAVFHNMPLAAFSGPNGIPQNSELFLDLDYTEQYWVPAFWDAAAPGVSTRLIKRWARYISALGGAHRKAIKDYLAKHPKGAGNEFHASLAKALGLP